MAFSLLFSIHGALLDFKSSQNVPEILKYGLKKHVKIASSKQVCLVLWSEQVRVMPLIYFH